MLKLERMEMKQLRCVGYKKRVWKQELNTDFQLKSVMERKFKIKT